MTTDIRTVLDDVARGAPHIDVTDQAMQSARHRRRVRVAAIGVAAIAVAALGLALWRVPVFDSAPPPASSGSAPRYDPTVEVPWPFVHALPRKLAEPIAMSYVTKAVDPQGRIVSASGRQWSYEGVGVIPSISDDGWHVALYDPRTDQLAVRDMRGGTERSFEYGFSSEGGHEQLSMQAPMPWSPDNSRLALSAFRGDTAEGFHIVVLDESGVVVDLGGHGQVVGWLDNDTVLAVEGIIDGGLTVTAIDLAGEATVISTVPAGIGDVGINHLALSPDGRVLAGIDLGGSPAVVTIDVASGRVMRVPCPCDTTEPTSWVSPTEVFAHDDFSESPSRVVAVDTATGATRSIVSFSPRFDQITDVSFAASIVATGPDGRPIASRWWPGWYLDYISYGLAGLLLLVGLIWLAGHRARRHPADPEKPVPPIGG
jgi:hypothetical protein